MNERLTEEKIRATIGEMLTSDLFKGVNTEANRDQIIAMLWNWVGYIWRYSHGSRKGWYVPPYQVPKITLTKQHLVYNERCLYIHYLLYSTNG